MAKTKKSKHRTSKNAYSTQPEHTSPSSPEAPQRSSGPEQPSFLGLGLGHVGLGLGHIDVEAQAKTHAKYILDQITNERKIGGKRSYVSMTFYP